MATLPDYQRSRQTIAFHEAGHIVLGWLVNAKTVVSAELFDAADSKKGEVLFDPSCFQDEKPPLDAVPPAQQDLEICAAILASVEVAGIMSETILHGIEVDGWLKLNTQDFRTAREILHRIFGHDFALYYVQCVARFVLVERWELVQLIAAELETKGKLDADDIDRLCAGQAPQDWATLLDKW